MIILYNINVQFICHSIHIEKYLNINHNINTVLDQLQSLWILHNNII